MHADEQNEEADLCEHYNDAWFGDTQAPHQHAMLATVQAMQYGRPLLRMAARSNGGGTTRDHQGETKPFTEIAATEIIRMARIKPSDYLAGCFRGFVFCLSDSFKAIIILLTCVFKIIRFLLKIFGDPLDGGQYNSSNRTLASLPNLVLHVFQRLLQIFKR